MHTQIVVTETKTICGPFAVFAMRDGHVIASTTGCRTRERAEEVAAEYRRGYA